MLKTFKSHINNNLNFLKDSKLLIAISGGLDSVMLTHLSHQIGLKISLAHCNFNLRADESDADEDFVLQLAEDLELEVFIENFDTETFAKDHKLSTQMAARSLRYHWFAELAEQLHFDYILTAHHADDNLETFLINLSRGTGLDGLTGIPEINGKIIRPLLSFSRDDLENYALQNKIKWREDSSNASTKYLRNKLRHDVIPVLKEINPQLLKNFKLTQTHLQASKTILNDSIDKVLEQVVTKMSEKEIHFSISKIKELSHPKAYLYEILKDYHFTEWQDVTDLLDAQTGKQVFSKSHRLLKNRGELILFRNTIEEHAEAIIISKETKSVNTVLGSLIFETTDSLDSSNKSTIYVDKDLLKYPLSVRKWEKGDYFYPFGMENKKKLSKFFKDEKLSMLEKDNVWLLCSEQEIVWILNYRADNRFKITNKTQHILKISLQDEI
ncbi:tRNA lysidine(34) synthetase TilS [Xanthomarina sp. F2636L]|uniref:tRNA lysidine(34) synthetase TilS n=1 Tax=Xanthomarina sp. F2636L TaxID=2996018 RepID=UPI00225E0C42|nr:tRNA lysidine(34) synthetase TilS [Xanthomarina sp. F2636L]MCX7549834.1 tRNA lysidine(34) synthetase TilS [Xanthomarina sp. F2636L]